MEKEYFDRVISLGEACSVSEALRKIGYREVAYPFDWNVTTFNFILNCVNSKFKIFEDIFSHCVMAGDGIHLKYTGPDNDSIYFAHEDWRPHFSPDKKKRKLNLIKDRYVKRGSRLDDLLNEEKKILFIRKAPKDSMEDAIHLKNAIEKNYPKLDFKILLINNTNSENVSDERIIHKYKSTDKGFITWRNDMFHNDDYEYANHQAYEDVRDFDSKIFEQLDPAKWHQKA